MPRNFFFFFFSRGWPRVERGFARAAAVSSWAVSARVWISATSCSSESTSARSYFSPRSTLLRILFTSDCTRATSLSRATSRPSGVSSFFSSSFLFGSSLFSSLRTAITLPSERRMRSSLSRMISTRCVTVPSPGLTWPKTTPLVPKSRTNKTNVTLLKSKLFIFRVK